MSHEEKYEESVLVALLLLIARRAPEPWYFKVHAQQTGANAAALAEVAEWLYLEGLVRKASGTPETGAGLVLTEFGQQVVNDEDLLDKLRRGEPLRQSDVGATVRQSLLQEGYPRMTRAIIGLNVAYFLYGALLASQKGIFNVYLGGFSINPAYVQLMLDLGAADTSLIVTGEWWRLVASTFVHSGMLHIGMNMLALNNLGKFAEQTWGSWRLVVIYAVAAWVGSCFAAGYSSYVFTVGASGAICGVMGAEGTWVLLYGRYLPSGFTRRFRSQFILNVVLLTFISLLPGISWQGHLGGAVGGAIAALFLHLHRFGNDVVRWPALLALPLIGWGCFTWMMTTAADSKEGRAALTERTERLFVRPARNQAKDLMRICGDQLQDLLNQHPNRRDPQAVDKTLQAVAEVRQRLEKSKESLAQAGNLDVKPAIEELIQTSLHLCDAVTAYLQKGENVKRDDERAIFRLFRQLDDQEANFGGKPAAAAQEQPN